MPVRNPYAPREALTLADLKPGMKVVVIKGGRRSPRALDHYIQSLLSLLRDPGTQARRDGSRTCHVRYGPGARASG